MEIIKLRVALLAPWFVLRNASQKNTTTNYVKSVNLVGNLRHVHSDYLHRGTVLHGVRENVPGSMTTTSVSQVLGLNLELSTLYALGAVHILRNTRWGEGGLPDLLQYYIGGASPIYYNIT